MTVPLRDNDFRMAMQVELQELRRKRCREALGLVVAAWGGIAYGRSHATDGAPN
jgi:hypothetical protein